MGRRGQVQRQERGAHRTRLSAAQRPIHRQRSALDVWEPALTWGQLDAPGGSIVASLLGSDTSEPEGDGDEGEGDGEGDGGEGDEDEEGECGDAGGGGTEIDGQAVCLRSRSRSGRVFVAVDVAQGDHAGVWCGMADCPASRDDLPTWSLENW